MSPIHVPETAHTVGTLLAVYVGKSDKDAATTRSALKTLFPETTPMTRAEYDQYLVLLPLATLLAKLGPDGKGYTDETRADLVARGFTSDSYLKQYERQITRFVAFGAALGAFDVRERDTLLPGWAAYVAAANKRVPAGIKDVEKWRRAGMTTVLGRYDIASGSLAKAANDCQNIRCALRRLAANCSNEGTDLDCFATTIVAANRVSDLKRLAPAGSAFYYNRTAWNALRTDLNLPLWADQTKEVSWPKEQWDELAWQGVEEGLLGPAAQRGCKPGTIGNYAQSMTQGMGLLHASGFDHRLLCRGLRSRKERMALLYGACPREILTGDPDRDTALALATRLAGDEALRREYVHLVLALGGSHDGREAIMNPFVALVVEERKRQGLLAAEERFIQRVQTINTDYLELRPRHMVWAGKALDEVRDRRNGTTTVYDEKKGVIYRHPRSWQAVIGRARELVVALMAPDVQRTTSWAVKFRNVVFAYVILLYPLRINHFVKMRLNQHYEPREHRITFEPHEVKNRRRICVSLPDAGRHALAREAMDLYLAVARPMLLGAVESPFVFVPDRRKHRAGLRLREKGFNAVLEELGEEEFADVLPPGLGTWNPHLCRHLVAIYQIVVHQSATRAAQFLADSIETVQTEYADIIESAERELRDFHETGE